MSNTIKLLITIFAILLVVGFVLGVFGFIKGPWSAQDNSSLPKEVVAAFRKTLIDRALARGPMPIEGFEAAMLLDIFPGLEASDFDGVKTGMGSGEGVHFYVNGELQWERTESQPITSAERTVSQEGYGMLLENLSERLGMSASSAEETTAIIDEIDIPSDITDHLISKRDLIRVYTPQPLSVITSPFTVYGEARGPWYFEADFQLTLVDWDGRIIAESYATARLDPNDPESTWMTEEFVPFEGTIEFELSEENRVYNRGALIFQKANPSGSPEQADALEIPILFK